MTSYPTSRKLSPGVGTARRGRAAIPSPLDLAEQYARRFDRQRLGTYVNRAWKIAIIYYLADNLLRYGEQAPIAPPMVALNGWTEYARCGFPDPTYNITGNSAARFESNTPFAASLGNNSNGCLALQSYVFQWGDALPTTRRSIVYAPVKEVSPGVFRSQLQVAFGRAVAGTADMPKVNAPAIPIFMPETYVIPHVLVPSMPLPRPWVRAGAPAGTMENQGAVPAVSRKPPWAWQLEIPFAPVVPIPGAGVRPSSPPAIIPHRPNRPGRKTREKKTRVSGRVFSFLTRAAAFFTEALDFQDALYYAIPCKVRAKHAKFYRTRTANPGNFVPSEKLHRAQVSWREKTRVIAEEFSAIEWDQFAANLVYNQIVDGVFGGGNTLLKRGQRKVRKATGAPPARQLTQLGAQRVAMDEVRQLAAKEVQCNGS